MNVLISTLKEELATVKRLERKYLEKLHSLPGGSFVVRKISNKTYGYLTYRDGDKVRQKYLGLLDKEIVFKYKQYKKEKKELKRKLQSIKEQRRMIERALRHGKTK